MPVSKALKIAAQGIMDLYYQDFRPDDAFFDLEDFAKWIGQVYGSVADNVAKEIYAASRSEGSRPSPRASSNSLSYSVPTERQSPRFGLRAGFSLPRP